MARAHGASRRKFQSWPIKHCLPALLYTLGQSSYGNKLRQNSTKVKANIKIEDIYNKKIPLKVAQELLKISKARMKLVKDMNIQKYPSAQSDTSAARIT